MAYQNRIDAALALIDQHNAANGVEKEVKTPGHVDKEKFVRTLKAAGAVTEEDLRNFISREKVCKFLSQCTFTVIPSEAVEPVVLAAKVTEALKGNKEAEAVQLPETKDGGEGKYISSKKAHRLSHRELVENFDPEELDSPVATRLKSLSKGEPFVVYSDGRIVDVETTLKILSEIKAGHKGRTVIDVKGLPKKVYHLGEMPEAYAEENPLYPGRPLRPDGTCDQLNRSWAGVPLEVRQFLRVMLNEEHNIHRVEDAHFFLDLAIGTDPMKVLRSRYAEISVKFDELKLHDNLPKLLISLQVPTKSDGGHNRPFDGGKQIVWTPPPNPASNYYGNSADRSSHQGGGTYSWYVATDKQRPWGHNQ